MSRARVFVLPGDLGGGVGAWRGVGGGYLVGEGLFSFFLFLFLSSLLILRAVFIVGTFGIGNEWSLGVPLLIARERDNGSAAGAL